MIQLLSGIDSTSAALNAERIRMEVVSQNIANAHTTSGIDGKPYQRQQVVFESFLNQAHRAPGTSPEAVRVARVEADARAPRMIYSPHHPHADGQGMVAVPDINMHEEMADLIASSRAFEANLAVVKNAKQMAHQTLSIGR